MTQQHAAELAKEVQRLLTSNNLEEASSVLKGAIVRHPKHLRLRMLEAKVLEKQGKQTEARDRYDLIRKAFPNKPQANFHLARLAIAQGDFEDAETYLQAAEAQGMTESFTGKLRTRITARDSDPAVSRRAFERIVASKAEPSAALLIKLANICFKMDDNQAVFALAERMLRIDPVEAHNLAAQAAIKIGDAERAEREYATLLDLDPENPRWISGKMDFLQRIGENDKAIALLREAIGRGLAGAQLFDGINRLRIPPDIAEVAVRWAQTVEVGAAKREQTVAAYILSAFLNQAPSPQVQMSTPGKANGKPTHLYDWSKDAPADSAFKRALVTETQDKDILVAPAENSNTVVLVFTGLADQAMVPIGILDRYFAALNLTAVYLRDSSRLLFNNGVASVAQNFDGTVEYLRNIISGFGSSRLVSMGTSAGGYAAIRYGLSLGADCIAGFSAPTNLTAAFLADDGRGRIVANRLQKLPPETLDILPAVIAADGRTPIHLVYGEHMPQDKRHALYLKGAPGVVLHSLQEIDQHSSLTVLAQNRKLLPFLTGNLLLGNARC